MEVMEISDRITLIVDATTVISSCLLEELIDTYLIKALYMDSFMREDSRLEEIRLALRISI